MTSKSPVRSAEDVDEQALSYAEIKALCTGNPYIKEKMDLDIDVSRLKLLKANHLSQIYSLEDKVHKEFPAKIAALEERIKGFDKDIATANSHPAGDKDNFCGMTVKGVSFSEKKDAGEAIIAACKAMTSPDAIDFGSYRGFDMELSFVDVDEILEINEGFFKKLFKEVLNIDLEEHFQRMTYKEAMESYGSDKPDIRFDMKIQDISDLVKDCGFSVFTSAIENGGSVRAIVAKNASSVYTRKEIDKLTEYAKGIGAKGLAYVRWVDEPNASFKKFMSEEELSAIYERLGAEKGDVILIVADKNSTVLSTLGALRLVVAKRLDIIPDVFKFLWIVDFPFFEYDEESGEWLAMHHPFTMPKEECLQYLDTDPSKVIAKAYDLTLNGVELSSGSMRITDYELQQKMFKALKLTDEEIEAKFGFLVEAYKYGAPPHGGMGIGLDRVTMLMCKADSLRDVTAFPKVQNASELMSACPAEVDDESLEVLGIKVVNKED